MRSLPLWRRLSARRRRPAILCFHDVRDGGWLQGFLRELIDRAPVVSLGSLVDDHVSESLPEPKVAVTFDDGYKSIRTIVEPVCTELGIPFTTFVCGEVLQGGLAPWYERLGLVVAALGSARAAKCWGFDRDPGRLLQSALKAAPQHLLLRGLEHAEHEASIDSRSLRDRFMTARDLAEIARNPLVTVGSHTYSHPILSNLDSAAQRREIHRGIAAITAVCGPPIEFFAYPNGSLADFDTTTIQVLREAGVRAAFTTVQRPLRSADDVFCLPRLGISERDSVQKLELKWTLPWLGLAAIRERSCRARSSVLFNAKMAN